MDLGLDGTTVLVAAASRGLGREVARRFLLEGAHVAIFARDGATIHATREALTAETGGEVHAFTGDSGVKTDLERVYAEASIALGAPPEVLINNTGGPRAGGHDVLDDDAWQAAFDLTLLSAIRLSRLALPAMRKRRRGRIINISSMSVRQPLDNMMLSNSLRLGVAGWAKTLADEVAADGVLVNTICPGWTATDRVLQLLQQRAENHQQDIDEVRTALERSIPLGRLARPDEVAKTVVFFASSAASYITGTSLLVDGGLTRAI